MKGREKTAIRTLLAATVVFLIFVSTACDVFELRSLLEGEDGAAWAGLVAIAPGTINLTTGSTLSFSAKGGSGVYTFSMVTILGGTVDSSTGYYTAAGIAGSEVVRVTDSLSNSADAAITVTTGAASTPDYRVAVPPAVAIPPSFPAVGTGGGALAGDFAIENIGGDGADNIAWRVYISSNNLLGLGDTLVDSGGQGSLLAGAVSGLINYSGTWPAAGNTYFLIIELIANDDIASANNTYASGGIVVSGTPAPDYIINAVTSPASALTGAAINETLTIENQGAGNGSVAVSWEAYVSAGDTTIDTGDLLVTSGSVGALASLATTSPAITGNWPATSGTYYLVCRVSASDDADSLNNTAESAAVTVDVADVDYTIVSVTPAAPTAVTGGAVVNESFDIDNTGTDDGTQLIFWSAYVSDNTTIDVNDTLVGSASTAAMTAAEAPKNIAVTTGNWPATGGPYYLLVEITADDDTDPSIASNTDFSSAVTINPPDVDYTVPTVTWNSGVTAGQTVTGNFDIQNVGTDAGSYAISWTVYASLNNLWDAGDEVAATGTHIAIAGSTTQNQAFTGFWPATPGDYYLVARISASDDPTVDEGATVGTQTITAPASADVDYNITGVFWSSGSTAGGVVDGTFDIDNVGTDNGTALVYWSVYASLNNIWDVGDALVASGSTAAMTSIEAAKTVNFSGNWPGDPDDYFLVARASASDDATTAENATAASQTVTGPNVDYTIISVTPAAPTAETGGAVVNESFDIDNTGTDDGTQLIFWNAYVSDNTTIDVNDTLVGTGSTAAMTAVEAPRNIAVTTGNWPASGGPYYLLAEIEADDDTDPSIASNTDFSSAVTINPPDVDYIVSTVTYTGGALVPAATVNGQFQFQNAGTDDGVQNVGWTAYASTDMTLDPTDVYVDSGSGVASLATGATSAAIPFSGTWPLDYGNYYLLVKVSASDDVNVANDTGTTVGTQAVGIYSDIEPNGDWSLLVEYQDLGATLQSGMSLRVAGEFTDTSDLDDIFGFDTGTATAVTFSVTWSSAGADLTFYMMSGPSTFITGVGGTADWLSLHWTVDAPGVMRYLDLENTSLPAAPPGNWPYQYTLIITAD